MTLSVDTSVWSLALRRDGPRAEPAVAALHEALLGAEAVVTTGLVLQERLQGFGGQGGRLHHLAVQSIAHDSAGETRSHSGG